jgi:hypothetical protein
MKTYLVAYQVEAASERAELLAELERRRGFQVFPGLWRLHLDGTNCTELTEAFAQFMPQGNSLFVAEVADSLESVGSGARLQNTNGVPLVGAEF